MMLCGLSASLGNGIQTDIAKVRIEVHDRHKTLYRLLYNQRCQHTLTVYAVAAAVCKPLYSCAKREGEQAKENRREKFKKRGHQIQSESQGNKERSSYVGVSH